MHVLIPTFGADGGKSGISRYLIQLLREFAKIEMRHHFTLLAYESEREVFMPAEEHPHFSCITVPDQLRSPVRNISWCVRRLPGVVRSLRADAIFMPAANRRLAWHYGCPSVGTVHDFSTLHVPGKYDRARMFYVEHVLPTLMRRLDYILTVSESSKRDIMHHAKIDESLITVTPLGYDREKFKPGDQYQAQERMREALKLDAPYFSYLSRLEHPGKNHVALIRAYNALRQRTDKRFLLALGGSDWNRAEVIHEEARNSPYREDIRFLGFVSDDLIPDLYRGSIAMVYPSLYEGFGLPVLEALACGTPVVCSRCSSLPEVGGKAALMFDPADVEGLTTLMEQIAEDRTLRVRCTEKGLEQAARFSWESTAQKTLELLEKAAEAGRAARR